MASEFPAFPPRSRLIGSQEVKRSASIRRIPPGRPTFFGLEV